MVNWRVYWWCLEGGGGGVLGCWWCIRGCVGGVLEGVFVGVNTMYSWCIRG